MKKQLIFIIQKFYDFFIFCGAIIYLCFSAEEGNRKKLASLFSRIGDIEEEVALSGITDDLVHEAMILKDKLVHIDTKRYAPIRNQFIKACNEFSSMKSKDSLHNIPNTD